MQPYYCLKQNLAHVGQSSQLPHPNLVGSFILIAIIHGHGKELWSWSLHHILAILVELEDRHISWCKKLWRASSAPKQTVAGPKLETLEAQASKHQQTSKPMACKQDAFLEKQPQITTLAGFHPV